MADQTYIPESAMVIVAHPDDIEFTCGGTMALWAKVGCRIVYVLCTSGDVGIAEPGMTNQKAAEIREAETLEAARRTGVNLVEFLREPDGLLQLTLALRKKIVREIRRYRPEVVITGDPTIVFYNDTYINHPDHRAAATAALDAVFPAAGQPNLFQELSEEGLYAHKTRKVYITNSLTPEVFVSISDTLPVKLHALQAHTSQFKDWDPSEMVTQWSAERAEGLDMKYAEAFKVITLEDDEAWERLKQKQNLQG